MRVRGEVFSGALRGTPLIEKFYPRLIGLIGFRPFKGTMDVKMERSVDIRPFSTKTIDHILTNGRRVVTGYLAPIRVRKLSKLYSIMEVRTKEKEILEKVEKMKQTAEEKFSIKSTIDVDEVFYDCWAMQLKKGIYKNDVIEIIAKDMLKEKLGLEDGDGIEIEFSEPLVSNKKKRTLFSRQDIIMK